MLGERHVVASGVLVEQPAHVTLSHRRRGVPRAESGELEPRAVVVLGVGAAGFFERRNGRIALAKAVADGAEREPGGSKARRQFERLHQNIGGAGKIAAGRMVQRPFVAPVGDSIAGGDEERAGVGHGARVVCGNAYLIICDAS